MTLSPKCFHDWVDIRELDRRRGQRSHFCLEAMTHFEIRTVSRPPLGRNRDHR